MRRSTRGFASPIKRAEKDFRGTQAHSAVRQHREYGMANYIGNKFGQQDVDKLVCTLCLVLTTPRVALLLRIERNGAML